MRKCFYVSSAVLFIVFAGCGRSSKQLALQADGSMIDKDYTNAVRLYGEAVDKAVNDKEHGKLRRKLSRAQILLASQKSYLNGLEYSNLKQYDKAYNMFRQVISESEHYADAKLHVDEYGERLSTDALNEASIAFNKGDISRATNRLEVAQHYEATMNKGRFAQIKKDGSSILYRDANDLYKKGSYTEALSALKLAEEYGCVQASHDRVRFEVAQKRQERSESERQIRLAREAARQEKVENERKVRIARAQERERGKYYEGAESVKVAISSVKLRRDTGSHHANRNSTYVYICASAKNYGSEIVHVNPNDFTLADSNGTTASHNSDTYGLVNYFDAVNLRPGQSTHGWLIFLMLKDTKYTLGYQGYGGSASKSVIP